MTTRVSGIAMLDLDDFKLYNDTFGHMAGDVALETVVSVIKKEIRKISGRSVLISLILNF